MKNFRRKRILVTGGAGFLGSHLCERLLQADNEVICVDNFYTGSKENLAHLLDNPSFEIIRHDVTFPLYLEVDEIFNLAHHFSFVAPIPESVGKSLAGPEGFDRAAFHEEMNHRAALHEEMNSTIVTFFREAFVDCAES